MPSWPSAGVDPRHADRRTWAAAASATSPGLAASLFKRGCPVVHFPTTLLAQADSAIGGKTAIDAFGEKNLIGTFHQPALVVADPAFLDTLDQRQLRSGYAEVVKYGLIDDPAFFAWCEANGARRARRPPRPSPAGHRRGDPGQGPDRRRAISKTASGRRALLNLGHSFAHAIEAEAGLGNILHGEAVALGMVLAFRFSSELGLCPAADAERVATHLAACGLPTRLADVGLAKRGAKLTGWMARDKKNSRARWRWSSCAASAARSSIRRSTSQRLTAFLDRAP